MRVCAVEVRGTGQRRPWPKALGMFDKWQHAPGTPTGTSSPGQTDPQGQRHHTERRPQPQARPMRPGRPPELTVAGSWQQAGWPGSSVGRERVAALCIQHVRQKRVVFFRSLWSAACSPTRRSRRYLYRCKCNISYSCMCSLRRMIAARAPPPLRAACDDGFLAFLFAEPLDYGAVRAATRCPLATIDLHPVLRTVYIYAVCEQMNRFRLQASCSRCRYCFVP